MLDADVCLFPLYVIVRVNQSPRKTFTEGMSEKGCHHDKMSTRNNSFLCKFYYFLLFSPFSVTSVLKMQKKNVLIGNVTAEITRIVLFFLVEEEETDEKQPKGKCFPIWPLVIFVWGHGKDPKSMTNLILTSFFIPFMGYHIKNDTKTQCIHTQMSLIS